MNYKLEPTSDCVNRLEKLLQSLTGTDLWGRITEDGSLRIEDEPQTPQVVEPLPKPPPTTSQEFAKSVAISAASSSITWAWSKALPTLRSTIKRQVISSLRLSPGVPVSRMLKFVNETCKVYINFTDMAASSDESEAPLSGTCVFQHSGRIYWLQAQRNPDPRKSELVMVLSTYGRDPGFNRALSERACIYGAPRAAGNTVVIRSATSNHGIITLCTIHARPLKNILKSEEVQKKVIDVVFQWLERKEWYHDKGFSYKKTFILHGPPGSGKTSLIRSLAAEIGYSVLIVDFQQFTDESLIGFFATKLERKTLVLFEDFDADDVVLDRSANTREKSHTDHKERSEKLTLKGILNAFQGMVPLDEVLIFMTTNVLKDVDPALTRPGRVDGIVLVGEVDDTEVKRYIKDIFPDYDIPNVTFAPILGCQLESLYFEHQSSPDDWVAAIPKMHSAQ